MDSIEQQASAQDRIVEAMARAMLDEDPLAMGMLDHHERNELAQAAFTAALPVLREEFAKVADLKANLARELVPNDLQQANMAWQIAAAIRALDLGKEEG